MKETHPAEATSTGREGGSEKGHPFYPFHVLEEIGIFYILLGIVLTLSILVPFGLHEKADPTDTPEGIKPEWYFLPMYQALKYLPEKVGILGMGGAATLMILWPFIDKVLMRRFGKRRIHAWIGTIALLFMVGLGILGKLSETHVTLFGVRYFIDLKGVPHRITGEVTDPGEPGSEPAAAQTEEQAE